MTEERRYRDKEWLRSQLNAGRKQKDIAEECGVEEPTISLWVNRFGLSRTGGTRVAFCETCGVDFRYYPSRTSGKYCSRDCVDFATIGKGGDG